MLSWWLSRNWASGIELLLAALALFVAREAWRRAPARSRAVAAVYRLMALGAGTAVALLLAASGFQFWYTHRIVPPPVAGQVLFPGIRYTREVQRPPAEPVVAHIVSIDLRQPGLSFLVTPPRPHGGRPLRAATTSEFLVGHRQQLAINGDFFFPFEPSLLRAYPRRGDPVSVVGLAASRGRIYARPQDPGLHTLYLGADNRAAIGPADRPPPDLYNAISGRELFVVDGRLPDRSPTDDVRIPRTAVALDRHARTLLLIVVDGRQPSYSMGLLLRELGELALRHGAHVGLHLDGGGSSTLVVEAAPGRARVLSTPIHTRIPHRERPVANHLGVSLRR